ncbi:class I SAM-dependent methyltransferase [uncultured Serinicoccus sp.]|uniref:class I SAM-dependent methyltransferase n=1 Tax=uncultured Serinicoccus sp. TaxID=735514 RepID=UPI002609958C|nr:class I SAM-dependent methyltransferase [uncultured Serinicoccus sp.]
MTDEKQTNEFDHPVSAAMYDVAEGAREDLDHYAAIVEELGGRSVIDIGCGTGVLAILLAGRGYAVTGVDPAGAMLDVARGKSGAELVRWVHGTAEVLPELIQDTSPSGGEQTHRRGGHQTGLPADLAVMTGNVAQVFLTDEEWLSTLRAIHDVLVPGGHLVFETRIPQRRAWEEWARWGSSAYQVQGLGEVRDSFELVRVEEPYVTFRSDNTLPDGTVVPSESTLIFRSLREVERTLAEAGFTVREVRDAPDRPDREWVVLAQRS